MEAYRDAGASLPHDALYRTIASDVRRTILDLGNGAGAETTGPTG